MRLWLLIVAVSLIVEARGADWPQWRGPQRDGMSPETGWLAHWPEKGAPRELWRAQVGKGHSAVSVRDGLAWTVGWDGENDTVVCLDAVTGKVRWRQSYPCQTLVQWPGPRATPVVDGDMVYTLGQHGQLRAWDARSGEPRWQRNLPAATMPDVDYGFAWSPLVSGDLLLLAVGQKGLALRKKDGAVVWGDEGQQGACASPVPFELGTQRGVAFVTMGPGRDSVQIVGVDPRDGREFWRGPRWAEKWGAACVDPLIRDGHVFITTAEQFKRCARFSIRDGKLTEDWTSRVLASYTGNVVLFAEHLYGVDKTGILRCLVWGTGGEQWSKRGFGEFGSLLLSDGKLIIQTSKSGEVVVVEATPTGYRELRRVQVFAEARDTFTMPVLSHGRLYLRSYAGEVVCYGLRAP